MLDDVSSWQLRLYHVTNVCPVQRLLFIYMLQSGQHASTTPDPEGRGAGQRRCGQSGARPRGQRHTVLPGNVTCCAWERHTDSRDVTLTTSEMLH